MPYSNVIFQFTNGILDTGRLNNYTKDIYVVSCGGKIRTQWFNSRVWSFNHCTMLLQEDDKNNSLMELAWKVKEANCTKLS